MLRGRWSLMSDDIVSLKEIYRSEQKQPPVCNRESNSQPLGRIYKVFICQNPHKHQKKLLQSQWPASGFMLLVDFWHNR